MSIKNFESSREKILSKVKKALDTIKDRTPFPEYDQGITISKTFDRTANLWSVFAEELHKVHGKALSSPDDLIGFFSENNLSYGYCDPRLYELISSILPASVFIETSFDRSKVDDYQFGITRSSGAIAETGTVVLRDKETSSRLGALAPWVHIACVERGQIYSTIHDALRVMPDDPNIIWCTGPSKTADIEGILIEGVHGPGIQCAFLLP